ncbi:MAG: HAD family hydrolase [Candidatus Bathyarchaeia archaeon]
MEKPTQIKAVLFDMFDTLMIIEHDHAFYQPSLKKTHTFLVQQGINISFDAFHKAYVKARDALYAEADKQMAEPHFNLRIANALHSLGYTYDANHDIVHGATAAFYAEFMCYVRLDKNAKDVLKKLHEKYKLGIVSNFAIPECVFKLLEQHGLARLFDVVTVSAAVNKRKPCPEIFQEALHKLGVEAKNTVFVGDTAEADIQGAKNVGMKTIYIERRKQKEIEQNRPDITIKDLSQLLEAIEVLATSS